MCKSLFGNLNMQNQGNVSPPEPHIYSNIESKDNELAEMQKSTVKNDQ
jgi:hypothetical protein